MRPHARTIVAAMAVTAAVTTRFSMPAWGQSLANLAAAAVGSQAPADQHEGLFGTLEFRSDNLRLLPQWRRVVEQYAAEQPLFEACAEEESRCASPQLKTWEDFIETARPLSRLEQIRLVNSYFNRWPYRDDRSTYGVNEYWASPMEFLKRSGDCEDYAIAKFFALRQLGFGPEELRVVIIMDRIRHVGHAVLAVRFDTDILILDNLSDLILSHHKYKHYVPQYSMNETSRWAHVSISGQSPVASVAGATLAQGR